jgi:hypothetical protein
MLASQSQLRDTVLHIHATVGALVFDPIFAVAALLIPLTMTESVILVTVTSPEMLPMWICPPED